MTKSNILPGTHRAPRIIVAEEIEVPIPLKSGTVIFRPGQHLDNEILIKLAQDYNIATEER
jgi:hypothetical protein